MRLALGQLRILAEGIAPIVLFFEYFFYPSPPHIMSSRPDAIRGPRRAELSRLSSSSQIVPMLPDRGEQCLQYMRDIVKDMIEQYLISSVDNILQHIILHLRNNVFYKYKRQNKIEEYLKILTLRRVGWIKA